jgi:hypothetical protein
MGQGAWDTACRDEADGGIGAGRTEAKSGARGFAFEWQP